ncbi:MAG: Verru_Chthon cassette protein A, partial [Verrucomicrobiota bacterium]|nr:Verru_Chthon cassette protein A [Verrucomicrobiota bacterium]
VKGAGYPAYAFPDFPVFIDAQEKVRRSAALFQKFGDYDNGIATTFDGPYINKPDEGNTYGIDLPGVIPYFTENFRQTPAGETYFSPNRQIPGPGMLGSLPARLRSGNTPFEPGDLSNDGAWRTLLFRPRSGSGHPGAVSPPDHLWLDFFWMPVVEPYAISEPFSTAGKINMNYGIEPFSYIRRATGMVSVLRAEKLMAIPKANAPTYKAYAGSGALVFRLDINAQETLEQFDEVFAAGNVFRSASEICELELIPQGRTYPLPANYWTETHAITGDNSRERPYTNLQARLTTKSNTFTVHYRVQVLKKVSSTAPDQWVEGTDLVSSEFRGSSLIERYIDPSDPALPDFATTPDATLDDFYRCRIVSAKRFTP